MYIYIYIYIYDCFAYIILLVITCLFPVVVVCSYYCYYRYIKRYSRDVLPYKLVSMVKKVNGRCDNYSISSANKQILI